jgi:hypothetical protein
MWSIDLMSVGNSTLSDGPIREDFDAHGFSSPNDSATDKHANARIK